MNATARDLLIYEYMNSPLGELELCADETGLRSVLFTKTKTSERPRHDASSGGFTQAARAQLTRYFEGQLQQFDIPLSIHGTAFQSKVWQELCTIPYGKTISYLKLARQLGDEKCIRAAASANGKNPLAIIVPCHRVIGNNGKLVGYAGDLWRKQWLLEHEKGTTGGGLNLFSEL
ncbi:MAG: methylated-DNA--[protein]-cysteine S-methyltransferase [Bacteroidia bacterium]